MSSPVKVGVIVLQQLEHLRQSTSFHTSLSTNAEILSSPLGGRFFSLVRKFLSDFLFFAALILKDLKLNSIAFPTRRI
jgi:hypothetical protein